MEGVGAAVHHGFDGSGFAGSVSSWGDDPTLPSGAGPWVEVASGEKPAYLSGDDLPAGPSGALGCWLVPLPGTDAVPTAVLTVWRNRPGRPLLGHRTALARAAGAVDLALLRTVERQRLQHLAAHDALTGLANRATFRELLAGALDSGEAHLAIAYFDLDRFKPVNDGHGHGIGDDVLVEVATRMRSQLRRGDVLARMGGDEFTVLMRDVPDAVVAGEVVDRLMLSSPGRSRCRAARSRSGCRSGSPWPAPASAPTTCSRRRTPRCMPASGPGVEVGSSSRAEPCRRTTVGIRAAVAPPRYVRRPWTRAQRACAKRSSPI